MTTIGSLIKLNDDSKLQGVIVGMNLKTVDNVNTIVYTIQMIDNTVQKLAEDKFKSYGSMPLAFVRTAERIKKGPKTMSVAAKDRIAKAQVKRWNKFREEKQVETVEI